MFMLSRPSPRDIERFLDDSRACGLSYEPIGLANGLDSSFDVDQESTVLGTGEAVFREATRALAEWAHNHAEAGEELFKVSFHPDSGEVVYVIRAASRPRATLARLGYPVVRSLQARFRVDSLQAMMRAVGG